MKTEQQNNPTTQDRQAIRLLVRARDDFQAMRKRMDGRLGNKADGTPMNIPDRPLHMEDIAMLSDFASEARKQEAAIDKAIAKTLKRFPVWTQYMVNVTGCGPSIAAWLIAEIDIHEATTVSKIWQYAGVNPGMVFGKKDLPMAEAKKQGGPIVTEYDDMKGNARGIVLTEDLIRGDRLTKGYVSPYNTRLKTVLCGILADQFNRNPNSKYGKALIDDKRRLEGHEKYGLHTDTSKGHRHNMAKRKAVKMFIADLYNHWRALEGLEVRPTYHEEKQGHVHAA